jgi:hypothetical protein
MAECMDRTLRHARISSSRAWTTRSGVRIVFLPNISESTIPSIDPNGCV